MTSKRRTSIAPPPPLLSSPPPSARVHRFTRPRPRLRIPICDRRTGPSVALTPPPPASPSRVARVPIARTPLRPETKSPRADRREPPRADRRLPPPADRRRHRRQRRSPSRTPSACARRSPSSSASIPPVKSPPIASRTLSASAPAPHDRKDSAPSGGQGGRRRRCRSMGLPVDFLVFGCHQSPRSPQFHHASWNIDSSGWLMIQFRSRDEQLRILMLEWQLLQPVLMLMLEEFD